MENVASDSKKQKITPFITKVRKQYDGNPYCLGRKALAGYSY